MQDKKIAALPKATTMKLQLYKGMSRTCRFPAGLKIDDDDKSDKKETLTGGGGYDYLTITFDSPEEKTTNFGKELTNSDHEVKATLTSKGDELKNVES